MPSWRKIILSGSDAALNTLSVSNSITASVISASQFTGSLFGTSSWANNANTASLASRNLLTASVTLNTITFTKGDGSTFPITVNTGSGGTSFTGLQYQTAYFASTNGTPEGADYVTIYPEFTEGVALRVGRNEPTVTSPSGSHVLKDNRELFTNAKAATLDEPFILLGFGGKNNVDLTATDNYEHPGIDDYLNFTPGRVYNGSLKLSRELYGLTDTDTGKTKLYTEGGIVIRPSSPGFLLGQGGFYIFDSASMQFNISGGLISPVASASVRLTLATDSSSLSIAVGKNNLTDILYISRSGDDARIAVGGNYRTPRNTLDISGSLRVYTSITASTVSASGVVSSSNLSIIGFPNVSASLASLVSGVGTLQQVTDAGNTTSNVISSSFAGVGFYGTASWAINVVNGGGGGGGGSDSAFLNQSTAATTWSFTHNLGTQYPVITVYDTSGQVIIPQEIDGEDTNNLKIYFPTSQSGYATAVGGTSALTYYSQSLTTASVNLNTITFTKGDSTQFSITVNTGSFTGSLLGTSSWAINALTASFVNPLTQSVFISGNLTITGSTFISGGLSTQYIDFSTTATPAYLEGRVSWIDDTKTLAIDTELNGFSIEVGHQNVIRVRNETGITISRGRVVYLSGSSGNRPLIYTSSYELDPTSAGTVGLVAADIGSSNNGYVISNGLIRDINTTTFTAGAVLYLSSSGQLSTTAPVAPLHAVRMGKVITSAVAGIIHVDVDNGYEIGELHDIVDTSTSTTYGALLTKSGSVWKDGYQLTGSYGLTGSLTATSFTGSLFGTASWAQSASNAINSQTASFLPIGTYNITASWAQSASNAINARTASFINDLNQNLSITGAVVLSGSSLPELRVIGETQFTGSVSSLNGFTGSLFGTASWASNAITASYILNAISSSFASTASYVLNAVSSSFSSTASFTPNAITTASVSLNTITFTKGSGATFNITVDTGSGGGGGGSVTINNNVDNYLITATGTANTLNGEANLQYSSSILINRGRSLFTYSGLGVANTTHYFRATGSDTNAGFLVADKDGEDLFKVAGSIADSDSLITIGDVGNAANATKIEVNDATNYINLQGVTRANQIATEATALTAAGEFDIGSRIARDWSTTGPALIAGRIVYLSGSTEWAQAQANASGSSYGMLGVVINTESQREILIEGTIRISGSALSSGIVGQPVYLSAATAGQVSLTAPTGSGQISRVIGYVYRTSGNVMYFRPDNTYTEII